MPKTAITVLLLSTWAAWSQDTHYPAIADVHLHYNYDQVAEISPKEAVAILKQQNVQLAVVSSTPPELALTLQKAGGPWIIPLFRPYFNNRQRYSWFKDRQVLPRAREALESGAYQGVGEIHMVAGIGPAHHNLVLNGLIRLAIEFNVPLLIHIETSSHLYFEPLCQRYSKARFLLAHGGGLLDHEQIGSLMMACPNVWIEFSARDHWRYVQSPIVDNNGRLLQGWAKLVLRFPDRFMIGSDPYWPVEKELALEESDTGWLKIDEYLNFHRKWLGFIPDNVRRKLQIENARDFFTQH
ncbi:MAG: amidohydrolase [Gammaproteobacteria bacterium]|nr:amidohydrolase [Gammaproteobacteria bacterium]